MLHCTNPLYDLASSKPIKIYESEKRKYLLSQTTIYAPIFIVVGSIYVRIYNFMMIVIQIWQNLSSIEREVTLIVTDFLQLFPHIFGETLLIVTHIWQNHISFLLVVCADAIGTSSLIFTRVDI